VAEERAPWDGGGEASRDSAGWDTTVESPNLPVLRLLGQHRNALLLAEGPDGLYLIDQHRAHERIIYERLLHEESGVDRPREAIEPLVLELGALQAALLDDRLPELEELGIECEHFGGRSFLVRALPAMGEHEDLTAALPDLFDELIEDDEGWRERLLVNLSCRAALRKGRPLTPEQGRDLLAELGRTTTPLTCPHGAPIVLHLDGSLLSRQFGW
jgi:DNA mismatch repair protein MutL